MEGYITILHLALYFIIVKGVIRGEKDWMRLFKIYFIVSVLVSTYALIMDPVFQKTPHIVMEYGQRIYGTIGNPPFLASYLLMSVFVGLIVLLNAKKSFLKWCYFFLVVINSVAIYFTASRGAILAGLIGALILSLFHIIKITRSAGGRIFRKALVSVIGVLIIVSALYVTFKDSRLAEHDTTLHRFATMFSDHSVMSRFNAWSLALEGIKERPLLGWGQENFIGVYTVNPIPLDPYHKWIDRAHNIVIEWLVNAGILGLLSYLALFGSAFYMLWRNYQKKAISINVASTLGTALAVYFIQNNFSFDTINTYLLFFTLLAYIDNNSDREKEPELKGHSDLKGVRIKFLGVILCALMLFSLTYYYLNHKPMKQSQLLTRMSLFSARYNNSFEGLLDDFNNILSLRSFGDDRVREGMRSIAVHALRVGQVSQEGASAFIAHTAEEVKKGVVRNQHDLQYLTGVISFYRRIARFEPSFIDDTEALIRACINLNPQYERLYFMLADILALKGDNEKAMEIANHMVARHPDSDFRHFELALIAIRSSRDDAVRNALEQVKAIRRARHGNLSAARESDITAGELQMLARVYVESDRSNEAIDYYKQAIVSYSTGSPIKRAGIHFKIAGIYERMGEREAAVEELKTAAELDPKRFAEGAEKFINSSVD
jgi:O-antigen ligase/tetratricopeptide (TPR) repeat protein